MLRTDRPRDAHDSLLERSGPRSRGTASESTRCARPPLRYGPSGDTPPVPRLRQQLWASRPGLDGSGPAAHDDSRDAADRRIRDGAPDRNRLESAAAAKNRRVWLIAERIVSEVSRVRGQLVRRWRPGAGRRPCYSRQTNADLRGSPHAACRGVLRPSVNRRDGHEPAVGAACAVLCRSRIDVLTEPNRGVPFHVAVGVPFLVAISTLVLNQDV